MNNNWKEIKERLMYHKVICKSFDRYGFPSSIGLIAITAFSLSEEWLYTYISLTIMMIWNILQFYIMKQRKKVYLEDNKLKITEDGFSVDNNKYKGIIKWTQFKKLIEDNDVIMVFNKKTILPVIIDKTIYSEEDQKLIRDSIMKNKLVEFSLRRSKQIEP